MNQNKSFRQPFSKGCGFQRQSLWSHVATCETLYRQAPFEGKSRKTNCLAAWGTFCKRKSSQLTIDSYNPEKPPGGRFFCCRTIKPSERKTAQRLFRRHDAASNSRIGCVQNITSYLAAPGLRNNVFTHLFPGEFELYDGRASRKTEQKKCPLRKVEGFSMRRGWKCGRFFVRLKVKRKGGSEWISSKSDELSPPSESVRD